MRQKRKEKSRRPSSHQVAKRPQSRQIPAKQPTADNEHTKGSRIKSSVEKLRCQASHIDANTLSIHLLRQKGPAPPEPVPKKRRIKKTEPTAAYAVAETAVPHFPVVSSSNRLTSPHPMRQANRLYKVSNNQFRTSLCSAVQPGRSQNYYGTNRLT